MLPKRRETKYLQLFNFQITQDHCQKKSEAPDDEDEELGEEDGQEETTNNCNKVLLSLDGLLIEAEEIMSREFNGDLFEFPE